MEKSSALLISCLFCITLGVATGCNNRSKDHPVGVGRSQVSAKIDLTDKLNPAILPDVLKEVLRDIAPTNKPDSKQFQQQVVQRLSQKIMEDPEVNYRVDLNEDGNLDPLLVVPESVEGKAAVYSLRVPDPGDYSRDPEQDMDWHKIAKNGIELVALSATFDQKARSMAISAESNGYLYEGRNHHHSSSYQTNQHSWMGSYFKYMILRDILFRPYGWYGPGWYGGWYGGFYGGWHAPARTRTVTRTVTRYNSSPSSSRTASNAVRSSKAKSRTQAPKSIQQMKSKRTMAARKAASTRSGGFRGNQSALNRSRSSASRSTGAWSGRSSASRRSSGGFRGGSRGYGK